VVKKESAKGRGGEEREGWGEGGEGGRERGKGRERRKVEKVTANNKGANEKKVSNNIMAISHGTSTSLLEWSDNLTMLVRKPTLGGIVLMKLPTIDNVVHEFHPAKSSGRDTWMENG